MLNKYLLDYLLSGTRGGETRSRIILSLSKTPMNMNRLAKTLNLDYKTVQHHLRVLEENNIISIIKKGSYGALYHISSDMQENMAYFKGIYKK